MLSVYSDGACVNVLVDEPNGTLSIKGTEELVVILTETHYQAPLNYGPYLVSYIIKTDYGKACYVETCWHLPKNVSKAFLNKLPKSLSPQNFSSALSSFLKNKKNLK